MDKILRGASTRFLELVGIRERNLIDELNRIKHLFATTAYVHGRSVNTTSNKKRLAVDNLEDGSRNKRLKARRGKPIVREFAGDEDEIPTDTSGESFAIEEWEKEDFFQFLESADEEILAIKNRGLDKKKLRNALLEAFKDKAQKYRPNEPVISVDLTERMKGMLLLTKEGMSWDNGIERTYILPGRDNAIDHSVSRAVKNGEQSVVIPPVGVEVKVPWNFPDGKVTSGDVDAGRVGRDISLVDLRDRIAIESNADYSVMHTKTDDDDLDVAEQDNSRRPVVARVSKRLQSQPRRNYNENHAARISEEVKNATYEMKHDVFPARQLVSYMLSAGLPFGYLTTGYRIDFCKLVVEGDTVTLKIAGPFWTVGKLHPMVAAFLKNPDGTEECDQKEMKTSEVFNQKYYGECGVRKFGEDKPMCFFRKNEETSDPAIELQPWSTSIGVYSCNEGLLRFLLAGTAYDTDANGVKKPRHKAKLPSWYHRYANKDYLNSKKGEDTSTSSDASSDDCEDDLEYFSSTAGNVNVLGKTKFGRLSLGDLQDPVRCKESVQPFEQLPGDAVLVGFGRNGLAFRKEVRGIDLVCKQVVGIGCVWEDIEERISNLQFEMKCYNQMKKLQGTAIPEFLFAGKLVDTRFWVCPELGHVYGLATTWEGHSLDTKAGAENVFKLVTNQTSQECDVQTHLLDLLSTQLTAIHSANILHNDLALRHVVCNGQKVSFIDFDAALICNGGIDYKLEKEEEKFQLQELVKEFWYAWGSDWCQSNV